MGCLIKVVKQKGPFKNISFIRLEKAMKKDKQNKHPNNKKGENK